MPKNEWAKSGKRSLKNEILDQIALTRKASANEPAFHNHVNTLYALAGPLVREDEEFIDDCERIYRELQDRKAPKGKRARNPVPDMTYRYKQIDALISALIREGTLGRAEIPFDDGGALEDKASAAVEEGMPEVEA